MENNNVGLSDLFSSYLAFKKILLVLAILGGIFGYAVSLFLEPKYEVRALLAPVSDQDELGSLARQYGGLASIAGVSLGSGSVTNLDLAMATLKSNRFLTEFMNGLNFSLPSSIDSPVSGKVDMQPMADSTPLSLAILKERLNIIHDKRTGLVTLTFFHKDPQIAADTLLGLIKAINNTFRLAEVEKLEASIAYLEDKTNTTSKAEIKVVLSNLIQSQLQKLMLAEVNQEYVVTLIDPPLVPNTPKFPDVMLNSILGFFFPILLFLSIHSVRFYFSKAF